MERLLEILEEEVDGLLAEPALQQRLCQVHGFDVV